MATLSKGTVGLLGEIVSLLHGAVASGLRLVNNLVSSGFKMAFQFNDSAMAFSRQAGLTAKQAQAYTEVLTTRAKELGEKYGIAAEEVTKLEKNLARATGRVIMLSNAQADMQVAINRTVGEETANQFSQMMMRSMGAQYSTVQGAVSKAYALAAKSGLDAAGMAAKVGQNLAMANRLTFRNGVDGLTKMVALSEKLGFNVQTIEAAANSFMDLQDAVENSAKMTMLGGAAGAFGGNPLDMTYEANYDPEAFGERLVKTLGGYAQFDEKTGMAKMNAMSRDFVKGIADAYHISLDEAVGIAKKQAEITYKNNNFGRDLDRMSMDENGKVDEKRRDFLLNRTQIENGIMKMFSTKTGKYEDMNYFKNGAGKVEFEDMMKFSSMSDEEIVREQAQAVVSIKDRLEGYFTSIQAMFAEKIVPFIQPMQDFLGDIYRIIVPHLGQIAQNVKELLGTLFMKENLIKVKDGIVSIAKTITWLGNVLTSNWKLLIGGALLGPLIGAVSWGFSQVLAFQQRNGVGASGGAGGGLGSIAAGKLLRGEYAAARSMGMTRTASAAGALNSTWAASSGFRKAVRGGGLLTAAMAGYGIYNAVTNYNEAEKNIRERTDLSDEEKSELMRQASKERTNEFAGVGGGVAGSVIGGAIGTIIAPGIGTAIGTAIGGWLGEKGGKAIASAIQGGNNESNNVYRPESHAYGGAVGGNITPAGKVVLSLAESKVEPSGASGRNNVAKDTIITGLAERELVINPQQQETLVKNIIAKPVGEKTVIYIPQNGQVAASTNSTLTVNDINVKFSGTLRLDGGSAHRDIDIKEILDDPTVRAYIANMVRSEFSSNTYMKEMRDTRFAMGYSDPSGIVGRMRNA